MNWWLVFIPLIGALIGWMANTMIVNTVINRILPRKQQELAVSMGKLAGNELFSFDEIEKKIAGPEAMQKIMPVVEGHIDHFLRNKLSVAFPMISMFIGEKTIAQLKDVFMQEMNEIFPQLMKNYAQNLRSDIDIEKMVSSKIAGYPAAQMQAALREQLVKELQAFKMAGALTGLAIGVVQLLLTCLIA